MRTRITISVVGLVLAVAGLTLASQADSLPSNVNFVAVGVYGYIVGVLLAALPGVQIAQSED